jgi:hypothetical protein
MLRAGGALVLAFEVKPSHDEFTAELNKTKLLDMNTGDFITIDSQILVARLFLKELEFPLRLYSSTLKTTTHWKNSSSAFLR